MKSELEEERGSESPPFPTDFSSKQKNKFVAVVVVAADVENFAASIQPISDHRNRTKPSTPGHRNRMIRFRPEILVEISEVVVRPWNWRISISRRTPKVPIGFDNFAAAVAGVERVGFVAPNFWTVPLPDFVALTQVRMSSLRRPCEERCSISKTSRSVTRSTSPQDPRGFVDWLCVAKRRPEKKHNVKVKNCKHRWVLEEYLKSVNYSLIW